MAIKIEKKDCCGCYACVNSCPKNCITMQADSEGFWYPSVDESICVECGLCERACPALNSPEEPSDREPVGFAARHKDDSVRLHSSSGGIFTPLAEAVLAQGGVVFGAACSEDCREVRHLAVEQREELDRLRGSKYLQSRVGETYRQAERALKMGRQVLFSGTPCQIEGLRAYLRQDYENLLCVDVICHGVPSPKVWKKYVELREARAGAPVRRMGFRHKKHGWKTYSVFFEFANGQEYTQVFSENSYMQAFLSNICLRPSCHQCHYKKLNRVADITLADLWAVQEFAPEMDDDQGVSLVLLHSEKGKRAFAQIADQLSVKEIDGRRAGCASSCMTNSVAAHPRREEFFQCIENWEFDRLAKKFVKPRVSVKAQLAKALKALGLWDTVQRLRGRS